MCRGKKINRKLRFIPAAILAAIGIALVMWLLVCPSEVYTLIGKYESKEAGLRAAIQRLPAEIDKCPGAYSIVSFG